jgi:uncharacterized protein (TIGR04255 family)
MARKMTHAPVYFAIVQVRFNPILALDSYAPQIQERFRKHGFPDAQRSVLATVNLNLSSPEGAAPQVPIAQTARYTFYDMNRTRGFILDQGALSFQTTEYDVFETLSGEFRQGLQAVHKAVDLSYTERIGFRYLDVVYPKADEVLGDYLNASVLGLSEKFRENVVHSFSETNIRSANRQVTVVARVVIQDGEVGFPPDLLPNVLRVADRFRALRGWHAILDTDGYYEGRESFNDAGISDHLSAIHDEISNTFYATVTPKALKVWK